jgi:alanine racemase
MIYHNNLEIHLGAIRYNYRYLSKIVSNKVSAVLKANAYGLGVKQISRVLIEEGCRDFFVSSLDEALSLKKSNIEEINIYVLNGFFIGEMEEALANNIIPVINHLDQLEKYNHFALSKSKKLPAILHFDTGMNRLGMEEHEILKIKNNPALIGSIDILYIMSHLSISEDSDSIRNIEQLNQFKQYASYFPNIPLSFANSSGIFLGPDYHFDMVRSGASLFGINPYKDKENPMENPVSLDSYILQLREVKKGQYIGYGNSFIASKDIKVATIPIGYADGYKRINNNQAYVLIGDKEARVVGNISMDLTTIDVTNIQDNKLYLGATVEVIGKNIHHDILGLMQGTIGYEVLTSLGNRYKRHYIDE